ncbi:hypothetical protein J4H92_14340 [Leucobacter weissii]|uniref:DUF3592 domain-containing protein n=1 Tax=Leucobacter weissii TaxID=1983706 RepID=A0A939MNK1_9MICO|nr:DUF3592 domain-containing protein [Leucobacter weissii]MBO1903120.1 hypothetical protein [Leucobacter weissii]
MSTVDPDLRWWRNALALRVISIALWVVVFLTALVTGWSNALYFAGARWASWAGAEWLIGVDGVAEPIVRLAENTTTVAIWPVLIAGLVDGYARHRSGGGEAWAVVPAFGWTLLGLGLGALAATFSGPVDAGPPILLTVSGALVLLIKPVSAGLLARHRDRQAWARTNGVVAIATVTKVDIETINSIDRWRATLKFEDQDGRDRWHRASIPTWDRVKPGVGDRYELRYDPTRPSRRSSIHVDLSRPVSTRRH